MTEECNLKLYSSVQEMKESTSLQYLFYGFSFQPKSFRVFFLFGNTFLRQRLSCQSTCQHFSLVRGIISQLCHKTLSSLPGALLEYSILPPVAVETSFIVTTETEHLFW